MRDKTGFIDKGAEEITGAEEISPAQGTGDLITGVGDG
jgi:hypothetical protein